MLKNIHTFPIQKISKKKKTEDWGKQSVDYIVNMYESDNTAFAEMETYYNLYNSVFNEEDLKYVTNPFKVDDGFPASPQEMNIIRPKIDLLIGEETKRPFNFRVVRTSQDAAGELQDKMKGMLDEYVMAAIMAKMDPQAAEEFQAKMESGEIMPPAAIQKYITRDYKDVAETVAYHSLQYLKQKLNLDHEFVKGWKDGLISSKEIYYVGILNGEPHLEQVNPMYFAHDKAPDTEFVEDGSWACRKMRMSHTEVYDRLYDKMDEKDLDVLLEQIEGNEKASMRQGKTNIDAPWNLTKITPGEGITDGTVVDVWHATWKSFKKIGFVTYLDEMGQPQQTMVDEDYVVVGTELSIEWDWIIEVWEGYKIGDDLYVGTQPLEYQHTSIENPNAQKLPYTGVIYSNSNSKPKSLVSIMKPLQYMYIVIWYRLELALARDKGKIINMDITQIPKSMGVNTSQWLHYLSSLGVNFFNPYEEGWDIPGREGGKSAQFNQFGQVDLTMSNVIAQYIQLMAKIEESISELSGVSRQRQGSITSSELVGNVERSVQQSAHITEPLFWMHNQAKKRALIMLLDTAKEAWRQSGKTKLHYIFDDSTRAFMDISEKFLYEDMDIFLTDSTKELQQLEAIRNLSQSAMQNGASLLEVAEIMTTDNMSMIKDKLADIEKKRMEQMQAQQEAEQQAQMEQIQAQNQYKEQDNVFKQQQLELEKYKVDTDNQTKIYVAELGAYRGAQDLDANMNGIPDPIEIGKLGIAELQMNATIADKQMQATLKDKEAMLKRDTEVNKIKAQKEIEEKKINLERSKLEAAERLQKLKDEAALEREKIKAKTALKNKVVGQK